MWKGTVRLQMSGRYESPSRKWPHGDLGKPPTMRLGLQGDGASLSDVSESSNQSDGSVVRLNWAKSSTAALSCSLLQVSGKCTAAFAMLVDEQPCPTGPL